MIGNQRFFKIYKRLIISLSIIASCVLMLLFVGVPATETTMTLIGQVRTLTDDVKALRTRIAFLDSIDEDLLTQQLSTLASAVPTEKSVPSAISTIEEAMAQSGISITDISFTKTGSLASDAAKLQTTEEKKIGISMLPFTVTGQGSIDAFRLFFTKIIGVRRLLRVDSIDIVVNNPSVSTIRMAMSAYYVPLKLAVGANIPLVPLTSDEEEILTKVNGLTLASRELSSAPAPFITGQLKTDPFSPLP